MDRTNQCEIWEHDFSYEGKKRLNEIACKNCSTLLIEWIKVAQEECKSDGIKPLDLDIKEADACVFCGSFLSYDEDGSPFCWFCDYNPASKPKEEE